MGHADPGSGVCGPMPVRDKRRVSDECAWIHVVGRALAGYVGRPKRYPVGRSSLGALRAEEMLTWAVCAFAEVWAASGH